MDFVEEIIKLCQPFIAVEKSLIEIPPDSNLGDYALPCFRFAKQLKKAPQKIAEEIASQLSAPKIFEKIQNIGPYINFFVQKSLLIELTLTRIAHAQSGYGKSDEGAGKNIVIDYSSPNIAKPFGIAHIRSTVIGHALSKIYSALGYHAIGINHLGDWGTQFGKLMVAYRRWGDPNRLEKEGVNYLVEIYIQFGDEAKKNPALDDEARQAFKDLEDRKPDAVTLWEKFRNLSLDEFRRYYDLLGIKFDYYHGESFYNDRLEATIKYVQEKIPTEISEGALIVDLKGLGIKTPLILRKSDEASTYHTRDIAAALYRLRTFDPEKILYVVGTPQKLHFEQLYATLELLGEKRSKFEHVNFGNMTLEGHMMSTRAGNFVLLSEVIDKAISLAKKTIEEKNPTLKNKDEVAKQVGIGAIIFGDLSNDRTRDVDFTWDSVLNFEGETAPYLQYTHARICSILRKAQVSVDPTANVSLLTDPFEFELVKALGQFPAVIRSAAQANKPHIIAVYLLSVGQLFNKFYSRCRVILDDIALQAARLLLIDAVRIVIANGLDLLGIQAPHEM
jgi:arginyl-tRNA synthetase